MGSLGKSILIICLMGTLIFERAQSLTCSSQTFKSKKFPNCEDLPYHNAFLHWNYDPANSSLSVAYLAAPSTAGGWVAWAVNPVRPGMVGAGAFIASLSKGAPSVRTYNLSSYSLVLPSPTFSFAFWDLAAEFADDRFTIFVTVKVPAEATSLNQVWQAGPGVNPSSGFPLPHELKSENMDGESELVFGKGGGGGGGGEGPAPHAHDGASGSPAPAGAEGNETAAPVGSAPAGAEANETTTAASAPAGAEANETTTTAGAPAGAEANEEAASAGSEAGSDKDGVAGIRSTNLGFLVGLFVFIWGINCS